MEKQTPRLAVPVFRSRVAPVLNWCSKILLLEEHAISGEAGQEMVLLNMNAFDRLRILKAEGVRTLICGALSPDLLIYGTRLGFHIISGVAGDIDEVLQAYHARELTHPRFKLPGGFGLRRHCQTGTEYQLEPRPEGPQPSVSGVHDDHFAWSASDHLYQGQARECHGKPKRRTRSAPRGFCTCPLCGLKIRSEPGLACSEAHCPQCELPMVRQ